MNLKILRKNNFCFEINDSKLYNIITHWQHSSNKFNKFSIFENICDYHYLRDYRLFYVSEENKITLCKYV